MNNVERAQAYIAAAYAGNMELAASFLSPEITLEMGGNNALAGTYQGIEAFFGAFGKMLSLTNFTYKLQEQIEWLNSEQRAVLLAIEAADFQGQTVAFHRVIEYHFEAEKIRHIRIYEGNPELTDRIFN